ncbi:MAG: Arc family DNA-binding protein [Hoeflea sp.]|nr:Arc family DNA-binding protein [Alphaproteobacteria bacterium]MBU4543597.1 Arc family DNA-binding protein [Alphaproteobacteria bacterium]MBU4549223.1 Arc family DNA-binding protein [Alphaproteobacteria bacterium]MBV1725356.1 Arc family DNA-binding protein [Hoeflea sp.]MBV1785319.1 Arc family DNA-binding protein [Hoeflea sp.]
MAENRTNVDQFQLRFPPGLREQIKEAAQKNARSMNAEIISRLEHSFGGERNLVDRVDLLERHVRELQGRPNEAPVERYNPFTGERKS